VQSVGAVGAGSQGSQGSQSMQAAVDPVPLQATAGRQARGREVAIAPTRQCCRYLASYQLRKNSSVDGSLSCSAPTAADMQTCTLRAGFTCMLHRRRAPLKRVVRCRLAPASCEHWHCAGS
jgi:hypothetical protein